jgi:creatinine amidohydrolase
MILKLENMNWMEFSEIVPKKIDTVILPIGTMEAHGVISLGTDVQIPMKLAEMIAPQFNSIIAPPIYYGITRSLLHYPGSVTVSSQTFENYVTEILESLADKKFSKIIILNGHGGHLNELKNAAQKVYQSKKAFTVVVHWWILVEEVTKEVFGELGGHAGLDETAAILAIDKNLVKKKRYNKNLSYLHKEGRLAFPCPGSIVLYKDKEGLPLFDEKKAKLYLDKVSKKIVVFLKEVLEGWKKIEM